MSTTVVAMVDDDRLLDPRCRRVRGVPRLVGVEDTGPGVVEAHRRTVDGARLVRRRRVDRDRHGQSGVRDRRDGVRATRERVGRRSK